MINFNGELLFEENVKLSSENRGFKYGDAVFETIKVSHKRVVFWEDHYFRLMASMRMLRMKIPMQFTLEFLEKEILKTVAVQEEASSFRVRLNVYRKDGGLYTPKTNEIDYLIDVKVNTYQTKNTYTVDVFKDFYNYSGLLGLDWGGWGWEGPSKSRHSDSNASRNIFEHRVVLLVTRGKR